MFIGLPRICHSATERLSEGKVNLRQTLLGPFKLIWLFPRFVANAVQRRRRQNVLDGLEAERLDRIRNPSKYAGK